MKYKILSFLLVMNLTVLSQNSSGIVKYEVSLNFTLEDILKEETKKQKKLNTMRKIFAESKKSEVILSFNSTQSVSTVSKRMRINERENGVDFVYSRSGREKKYFTSLITNSNEIQECKLLEKCYLIQQTKLKWKLTQETKIVGGYLCYKAINTSSKNKKKKPIAWYTPKISASFGPKQYFGLPGLILELEEAAVLFRVKEIILNPKNKTALETKDGIKITKEEYNKKLKKSYSDFYNN